ncbi:dehydrogenase [Paractinoplanes durhamensis]|uniref:Dehydrogenase n=1 Tax=Paractinoplanes durhamensis TaxID=113563 RepID=A0ABQ3Z0C0_9ACTN|nr:dehydrogenase [Actinoplanes durhamensis]
MAVIGRGDVSVVHLAAIEKLGAELVGGLDDRPDVVHICTPHDQHVPIAIEALERGIHVLLEKPVAHTVEEAAKLVVAASEHPAQRIGICLQNRYNRSSQAARDLLSSGSLGRIYGGSATVLWHREPNYYSSKPWRGIKARSGGGVLINQAIHTLDLLEWLLGDVVGLTGHTGRYDPELKIDVEDTAHARLEHAGGARSVFFATVTNVADTPVTIEINTERATLLIRDGLTIRHADGRVETISEQQPSAGRAYWGASHEALIADFYRTLINPEPFWIGPEEGRKSLHLVSEIYRLNT